jgi:Nif-specific regulatory protein
LDDPVTTSDAQAELVRRIFHLSALNDLGKEIGPLLDLERICATALTVTSGALGALGALAYLVDVPSGEHVVHLRRGDASRLASVEIAGGVEQVALVEDLSGSLSFALRQSRCVVWMPLRIRDRFYGGMGFTGKMSGDAYADSDLELLGTIRDSVTMALSNALLFADLHEANQQLSEENEALRDRLAPDAELTSHSISMQETLELAWRVADTSSTVLLRGESGTGKEVIARAIHARSTYQEGPFVAVHCAALPTTLLESELFGHEKGAFTDASSRRPGRFELADGGTLFLDEVGELPQEVQVKLLRVLQERTFERLGGTETLSVNCRLIAATHKHLEAAVKAGDFREDLYFRLNVVPIALPPLRDRREDIPLLVERFVTQFRESNGRSIREVSIEALDRLVAYSWPGNIRELQNVIERVVVVAEGDTLLPQHLPNEIGPVGEHQERSITRGIATLSEVERRHIETALLGAEWNQSEAARILGITRAQLRHRIKHHEIDGAWQVGAPKRKNS